MTSTINGQFVWYEHMTTDSKAAIAFYTELLRWKTQPFGEGENYMMWVGSQGPLGGVSRITDEVAKMGVSPRWMGNVQVESVDATVAMTKKLGGKIHKDASDIPAVGRFAVIGDPQGASLAIFTPSATMSAHDVSMEGEFCWNELMTTDSAAAFKFYSEIFGWKILREMDMGPMGTYRTYGVADKELGGMMTIPQNDCMPPSWMFYAQTLDLKSALARATKMGAKVMNGPMEVPGGGQIAQLTDPQGAAFALHQFFKN